MKYTSYVHCCVLAALQAGHAVSMVINRPPETVDYITAGKQYSLGLDADVNNAVEWVDDVDDECRIGKGFDPSHEVEAVFHDITDDEALALFPKDQVFLDMDGNEVRPGDRVELADSEHIKEEYLGTQGTLLPLLDCSDYELRVAAMMFGVEPDTIVSVESEDGTAPMPVGHVRRVAS